MPAKKLYSYAPNIARILNINVNQSHSASTTSCVINCLTTDVDIGDYIDVAFGYEGDYETIFRGYVKQRDISHPDGIITLTAQDVLVRAVDYFIVSADPEEPYKFKNKSAEDLIAELLAMAGLTSIDLSPSYFTLATKNEAEINLVSVYDYCKSITDLLAYNLYASNQGIVYFKNRKPYVMDGTSGQPGDDTDETPLYGEAGSVAVGEITDSLILDFNHRITEKDLRNRIVVYGAEDIHAEASSATSYDPRDGTQKAILPAGFYKSAAAASPIIDDQSMADDAAEYNLNLYNRLMEQVTTTVEGNPNFMARSVLTVNEAKLGINKNYYIYSCSHNWSAQGYTCSLELQG